MVIAGIVVTAVDRGALNRQAMRMCRASCSGIHADVTTDVEPEVDVDADAEAIDMHRRTRCTPPVLSDLCMNRPHFHVVMSF